MISPARANIAYLYTMTLMKGFEFKVNSQATRVVIERGVLAGVGQLAKGEAGLADVGRVALISDDRVAPLYSAAVVKSFEQAGFEVELIVFPAGEASKTLATAEMLFQTLADKHFDRSGLIVALGGGVVSDLAGFVAATYKRGVRFVIIPTTLESDVDACLGGKTAVNLPAGKNLVGAFHQPALICVDPNCLTTLDARDIRAGLAESVKHALIASPEFLTWHEQHIDELLRADPGLMETLIERNLKIKADIVSRDPFERGDDRMLLNLGHTLGHAIESQCGYAMRHGECVSLGLLGACRLSHTLGLLDIQIVERVETLLRHLQLPTTLPEALDADKIAASILNDKKVVAGKLSFVLLRDVGDPVISQDVTPDDYLQAYRSLIG